MRYVEYDPTKLKFPDNWSDDAKTAREAVATVESEDRSAEIKKHQRVWASLKNELSKVFHGKCWYTEAYQKAAGTDTDVDHFRPKNAVKGVTRGNDPVESHPGYWWLAFEPSNYRYSCIIANRARRDLETGVVGGKVDEFPVVDEVKRCWCPEDDADEEQALLIDPCKADEVALISFADNGEAITRHNEDAKPRLWRKADNSISLYHINHSDFVKARIEIRDDLRNHIEDAKRYFRKLETGDATNDHAYRRAIEEIRKLVSVKAPFSSFALTILEAHRSEDAIAPALQ